MRKELKGGFTLIELVVVMAIIAILATLMVAAIVAARNQSTTAQRTGNVKTVEVALETRYAKCQSYKSQSTCVNAIDWTSFATLQNTLKNDGELSQVLTGDLTKGYSIISSGDTNYKLLACNAGSNTCTVGTNDAYDAVR